MGWNDPVYIDLFLLYRLRKTFEKILRRVFIRDLLRECRLSYRLHFSSLDVCRFVSICAFKDSVQDWSWIRNRFAISWHFKSSSSTFQEGFRTHHHQRPAIHPPTHSFPPETKPTSSIFFYFDYFLLLPMGGFARRSDPDPTRPGRRKIMHSVAHGWQPKDDNTQVRRIEIFIVSSTRTISSEQ